MQTKNVYEDDPFSYASMRAMPGRINWHLNDLCNFKCEYCFFPYFTKENPNVGRLSPQQIVDAFNRTGRQWHIYMAGGETMLYPNFIELVNLLKPYHPIYISTNLSNKCTRPFAEQVSPENIISINASIHIGQHTETSLQKFIDNYLLYRAKGFRIIATYVTYPPLFERLEADFAYLKSKGVDHIHPLTFQGEFEGKQYPRSYTLEEIRLIHKYSVDKNEMFTTMNRTNFKGKLCRAGTDYFFMDVQGNMFRCATLDKGKSYGNLFEGTFKPDDKITRCPVSKCNESVQGIASLINMPKTPTPPSDFEYAMQKGFQQFKKLLAPHKEHID